MVSPMFLIWWLKRKKAGFTDVVRGSNKRSIALVWHLGSMEELANNVTF